RHGAVRSARTSRSSARIAADSFTFRSACGKYSAARLTSNGIAQHAMTLPAHGSAQSNEPGSAFELYRHLWNHPAGHPVPLLGSMTALVTAQCILLAVPYFAGHAINALQSLGVGGLREAALWLALVVAATALSWLFHGPGRILERNVSIGVRRRVANGLLDKLTALPLTWHEANHSAATAHRLQQSSHALSGFA